MLIFQVIFKRGFTVKITIIDKKEDEEDEIIVKCSELDESLLELINSFKKGTAKLSFYQGSKIVFVDETDIYYFESVENRVFAYTESEVYEIKLKLYELEEKNILILIISGQIKLFLLILIKLFLFLLLLEDVLKQL